MPVFFRWRGWPILKTLGRNLGLLTLGSILCAAAINGILIPNRFSSGGVTRLALFIHYLLPLFPAAVLYSLANVPLFIVGRFFCTASSPGGGDP